MKIFLFPYFDKTVHPSASATDRKEREDRSRLSNLQDGTETLTGKNCFLQKLIIGLIGIRKIKIGTILYIVKVPFICHFIIIILVFFLRGGSRNLTCIFSDVLVGEF